MSKGQVKRLDAAFNAGWDRGANGLSMPPLAEVTDYAEEALHLRLGFLTGMLHASADVPAAFRLGWNPGKPADPIDLDEYA